MNLIHLVFAALVVIALTLVERSQGHGYLIDPPSRSSMWRKGFNTPKNYDDMGVLCSMTETRCGVCGNRDNESGGKYATGTIAKTFRAGQRVTLTVQLTTNHKGYFQFSLCPNTPESEQCFQRYILDLGNGKTKYTVNDGVTGPISIAVNLPRGVTCNHCVLRWFYKTGNSWGTDPRTGAGCLGCGNQERFFGCSDIAIRA